MHSDADVTIVLVEDDVIVVETLRLYLEEAGYSVLTAADGPTGLRLADTAGVGAVVVDVMIPGLNGFDVCRQLRAKSAVPILMLTARTSEQDRLTGFDLGADDYVPKPFSPREVVARVHALLRRTSAHVASHTPVVVGELEVDLWSRQARVRGRTISLTATEFRVLAALARHPGRVFTREELVARAFGPDYEGLDRTVDVHITNLRRKLEEDGAPRYVLTSHGLGYRLADRDSR
jgi:DNA-binding response OmpR family regulator